MISWNWADNGRTVGRLALSKNPDVPRDRDGNINLRPSTTHFSPHSRYLACLSYPGGIFVFDLTRGDTLVYLDFTFHKEKSIISGLEWTSDRKILTWSFLSSSISIWNVQSKKLEQTIHTNGVPRVISVSSHNQRLAYASWWIKAEALSVPDLTLGSAQVVYESFKSSCLKFCLSTSGDRLALAEKRGKLKVWDLHSKSEISSVTTGSFIEQMVFSPDGRYVAFGTFEGIQIRCAATGFELFSRNEYGIFGCSRLQCFPSGAYIFVFNENSSDLSVWRVEEDIVSLPCRTFFCSVQNEFTQFHDTAVPQA